MKRYALALALLLPCLAAVPDIDKAKSMGSPDAPVVMEVFASFDCPHCHRDAGLQALPHPRPAIALRLPEIPARWNGEMRLPILALTAILCCAAAGNDLQKGKILGSPTAPIRIDVYSDFACPACKNFHETTLLMIVQEYVMAGKVYIVNREFPLNIPE